MQQQWREESEKRESAERRSNRERVEKLQTTVFFPMFCTSGGSKSRLATAAGAEPVGRMRDQKLHVVVVRRKFGSQNGKKTPQHWSTFGTGALEKVDALISCGVKHIWKSKCSKHFGFAALLDVEASLFVAGAMDSAP